MTKRERYQCPCCGNYTLGGRGGFEICKVCFWEDDDGDDTYGQPSPEIEERLWGPNHVHLRQARENYLAFGAAEEKDTQHVRAPREDEMPNAR